MTAATAPALSVPLTAYAERFHAAAGREHHVGSPLGAWLLLALAGPACTGAARNAVTAALGCEVATAASAAADLLAQPHPLVAAGAAAWHRDAAPAEAFLRWQRGLPAQVEAGVLPDQARLDDWARAHSLGLISKFPLRLTPETELLLATALATRVSWARPFDLAPATALGPDSPWAERLHQVLRAPPAPGNGHQQFIAVTEAAGDVVVHTARAAGGLAVTSVAAAPDVPPAAVITAGYELATGLAAGRQPVLRSLFDLELGSGPLWSVTERPSPAGGRKERCTAVLPAWSASSSLDLSGPGLGYGEAVASLASLLGLGGHRSAARQACAARFSRTGFEAAAVSAIAVAAAARRPSGLLRTAELRFGHPYAVVAVATSTGGSQDGASQDDGGNGGPGAAWHGLPVFSAWVAEPEEADPGNASQE